MLIAHVSRMERVIFFVEKACFPFSTNLLTLYMFYTSRRKRVIFTYDTDDVRELLFRYLTGVFLSNLGVWSKGTEQWLSLFFGTRILQRQ